ncbi:E3 ubiquitin-protein ligase TRIM39-like [Pseudophryne corroboree]|uniref:E3 ubiquitin-protein ligase TRIM39-like n=1 Tax=Pseudophryne corroboree TaxID=495146 RepID=UPI003081B094
MDLSALMHELKCSICLSLYSEPVLLRCGHNFCKACIAEALDAQEETGVYSCPDCRMEYLERPVLQKSRKLCNIVKHLTPTRMEQMEAKVFCTYCDSRVPAAKTCLQCETYLCNNHLRSHKKSMDHVLVDPTTSLENLMCPIHHKIQAYYCAEDAANICVSCFAFGKHRGHLVETIGEALEKKKKKLRVFLDTLSAKRDETERRVLRLQEHMDGVQEEAASVQRRVTGLFKDIWEELEALERRVVGEISRQATHISLKISDLLQELKMRKEAQSQIICHIEDLYNRHNSLSVLQGQALNSSGLCYSNYGDEDDERYEKTFSTIGDLNEGLITETLNTGMSDIVTIIQRNISTLEVLPITMDLNTAHNRLELSSNLKTISDSCINHGRSGSTLRFSIYNQILSVNSFTLGQHYWEVETSFKGLWDIGLAYPSIKRNGKRSGIGDNAKSWCLRRYTNKYMWAHNSNAQSLLFDQCSQIIGIYLDYEAGRLSFYELCDPDRRIYRHLHTFTATFVEPLHVACYVGDGAWVRVLL